MTQPRVLKIVCEGEPYQFRVIDVESGQIIANVAHVEVKYGMGERDSGGQPTAVITLTNVPMDLQVPHPTYRWIQPQWALELDRDRTADHDGSTH